MARRFTGAAVLGARASLGFIAEARPIVLRTQACLCVATVARAVVITTRQRSGHLLAVARPVGIKARAVHGCATVAVAVGVGAHVRINARVAAEHTVG